MYIRQVSHALRASLNARSRIFHARRHRFRVEIIVGLAQLAARAHLFVSSTLSDGARHTAIDNLLSKRLNSLLIAALELAPFVRVEVNQVYFARQVAGDFDETLGILIRVVHPFKHDVLEKHLTLVTTESLARELPAQEPEQRLQIVLAIDWHDPIANVIRRGVERHRETRLALAQKPFHLRNQPTCAHSDFIPTER